jgi:peptidoglycan hydrolase CwlO-like protein
MKKIITIAAITLVVTVGAVTLSGAIATATPSRQDGTAAANRKLDVIYKKLTSLGRQMQTLQAEVQKARSETNTKLYAIERTTTTIGYETSRILRCVQHLGGNVGSCTP